MSIKQILFSAVLSISASASAQQLSYGVETSKDMPQSVRLIKLAGDLLEYGRRTKSALPLIQAVQIYRQLNVADDDSIGSQPTDSPFSEANILADATIFADGNKNLLSLISDLKKSTRGAGWTSGPRRILSSVDAWGNDEKDIWFKKGSLIRIVIDGQNKGVVSYDNRGEPVTSELQLTVYDKTGREVARDKSKGQNCIVSFIPYASEKLSVIVSNVGGLSSNYVMYIYKD